MQNDRQRPILGGNSLIERMSRLVFIVIACSSALVIVYLAHWKKTRDERNNQIQQANFAYQQALKNRLDRIILTASKLVTKERGYVVFNNGTLVIIPVQSTNPMELAKDCIKITHFSEVANTSDVEGGHLICRFSNVIEALIYADEIKAMGRAEAIQQAILFANKDQEQLVVKKILMPKP